MLSIQELLDINQYLQYLACGINENGLDKVAGVEVLTLASRCRDTLDALQNTNYRECKNEHIFRG